VRGGALPLFAWGALLLVLLALNWIWTGDAIQVGSFAFAALVIIAGGGLLALRSHEALRGGAPRVSRTRESVPQASFAAVLVGLSVGAILFGLTFGRFIVYFGAGMLVISLGRLALELRAERASRRGAQDGPQETGGSARAGGERPG